MARNTIDFGIDLGTTNSAIAVLRGTIPEIIKNNEYQEITASAVYIDRRGRIRVGQSAKGRVEDEGSADDVYTEFKRRMGISHKYEFKSAGKTMQPEELSAEVLKSLRGDVRQKDGEEIQAAVITVPAAFEQKQCAATRLAGQIAGLHQCPLVQEPVAAAMAYGFQSDVTKEYWLVYDFGGGTFDAAIMKAEDGTISVVNHGGDNFLGGANIDWAILEELVIPKLTSIYNLPGLSRGNARWRIALAVLKRAVEDIKIKLSRSDTEYLENCLIKDNDDKTIDVELELTRDSVIRVVEPIIMRSVEICKRALKEKNLSPSAIEKVILVGGPTLAPYFREILHENLKIQLDHSVDPLTIVARGAAVFAGTQRIEGKAGHRSAPGQYEIELRYNPIGPDDDPTVQGRVQNGTGGSVSGFTIEFVNQLTLWRSGKITLKETGIFKLDLLAKKGSQNVFTIELLDPRGNRQSTVPDNLSYTIGLTISEQTIMNSVAVAMVNNECDVFFKKGDPLPAKTTRVYRSVQSVQRGSPDHVLIIPVIEGEVELADRNPLLGKLKITGLDVRRDVPAGSEVEVTLHYDESRLLLVKAYIPILDEEFEVVIDHNKARPEADRLEREYEEELRRLEVIRDKADEAADEKAMELLDEIDASNELDIVQKRIAGAKADPDAAQEAEKRLLEVKIKLDRAENAIEWPALVSEANKALDELGQLAERHGTAEQQKQYRKFREEVNQLIEQKRAERLRKTIERITGLHYDILFKQPGFWLGFFDDLVDQRSKMVDQSTAEQLINHGRQCINRDNMQGLRNVISQLWGLLPREEAEAIRRRAYESVVQR